MTGTADGSVGVHAKKVQSMRKFELDRPKALNALNLDMIYAMTPQLQAWQDSDLCKVIVLAKADGNRAFCAGGDVKTLAQQSATGLPDQIAKSVKFMEEEYKLNHLIGTVQKPFVSVLDGVTMGGGVGLSVHGHFRIATENTRFAMPETAIGLFPDVGGSFFLPRLDGELGTFLGLTGHHLLGEEVFIAGIATHYVPSARLPALYARLAEVESDELDVINAIIDEFSGDTSADKFLNWSLGGETGRAINRCFRFNTLEEIFGALEKDPHTEWAQKQLSILKGFSPTSMKLTLAQLRKGATRHFAECFKMEYRIVRAALASHDFVEGVTAKLISKPARTPDWKPDITQLASITPGSLETRYFNSEGRDIQLYSDLSYYDYPHRTLSGLPTDRDIRRVVFGDVGRGKNILRATSRQEVLDFFARHWGSFDSGAISKINPPSKLALDGGKGRSKVGLREKVMAVLETRTVEAGGVLQWTD
ncbi:3-hydroxyisobutyryl-CoA hydrolase [Polyrhizophydium stewartii]|uniref:3-hydroxyisobutyryl-CoA hydrolase n=1 Tax=Polyrhizophydium stewartii TaxID=2732419 RepID=A0ABR4NE49_9FUNG|nr:hypothetical protein HK105_005592 [Polyrhizophydium stewartii]